MLQGSKILFSKKLLRRSILDIATCRTSIQPSRNTKFTQFPVKSFYTTIEKTGSLDSSFSITDVKEKIERAFEEGRYPEMISSLIEANKQNLKLETKTAYYGIQACLKQPTNDQNSDLAFWLYETMKVDNIVSIDIYERLMQHCVIRRDSQSAIALKTDFTLAGYEWTEKMLIQYLLALATNIKYDVTVKEEIQSSYSLYKTLVAQKMWAPNQALYEGLVVHFAALKHSGEILGLLMDMTEANISPTLPICNPVLKVSLYRGSTDLLRVLTDWYTNIFNVRFERGVLDRMLQVSAASGDAQHAMTVFQLLGKYGLQPSRSNYYCLLRALLLNDDVISTIEVLQQMAENGHDFTHSVYGVNASGQRVLVERPNDAQFQSIKNLLVSVLCTTDFIVARGSDSYNVSKTIRMDELYFALLDQKRQPVDGSTGQTERIIPRLALDAVVETAGRYSQMDRAFATFQEYRTLFKVSPDTNSFNSLLWVCARNPRSTIRTLLSIFEDMEDSTKDQGDQEGGDFAPVIPCVPNERSFGILIEAMVERDEMDMMKDLLSHMRSIIPPVDEDGVPAAIPARALRRAIVWFGKRDEWEEAAEVIAFMKEYKYQLPYFTRNRLRALKQGGAAESSSETEAEELDEYLEEEESTTESSHSNRI